MSVEFIGAIFHRPGSESTGFAAGPSIDRRFLRRFVQAHEDGDFDRVLVAVMSSMPESTQVAAYAAAHSERIGFLVAHRPGFVFPTLAARTYATLDQFSEGRIALHTITGGIDHEQQRDGDYLSKEERYARTDEYLEIVKRAWSATEPFDYDGRFYRLEDYVNDVRPFRETGIPVYFGGSSESAYRVGGKHADVYALWGEPLAETSQQIESIRLAALAAGRSDVPGISVSFRPILGPTEELAWERAHRILAQTKATIDAASNVFKRFRSGDGQRSVGSERLLAAAARGELHDRALWTPLAQAVGGAGNSTALVGTPETVAAALLDYVDIGVTTLLIRGYEPYEDAIDYGRELIPLVRQELAHRERTGHVAEQLGDPVGVA
jgi:alkanesulfonate monooxygenase